MNLSIPWRALVVTVLTVLSACGQSSEPAAPARVAPVVRCAPEPGAIAAATGHIQMADCGAPVADRSAS